MLTPTKKGDAVAGRVLMSKNYFEIFQLPTQFNINSSELETNYLKLQQQFHPDNNPDLQQLEHSILINQAYQVLNDDFSRASYLLQLKNIDIENDDNPIKPTLSTLQEILELQEEISMIDNLTKISQLKITLKSEIENLIKDFCNHYEINKIKEATQFLIKAKYLKKSLNDLKNQEKILNKK